MYIQPKDIFSIENPETLICRVGSYVTNDVHSLLAINISIKGEMQSMFAIQFVGVRYFSGPMIWVGATFQIAPYNEGVKLLRNMYGFEDYPLENEADKLGLISGDDYYKLYVSSLSQSKVEVIAKYANVVSMDDFTA